VLACVFALVTALPASATSEVSPSSDSYLALGDSVPFGYNPLLVAPGVNPASFVGYPQLASKLIWPDLTLSNASCPGETSTSLVEGPRLPNGCARFRSIAALHASYPGSQLQYAESYVAANPRTRLVSLMIGANDLFGLQDACAGQVPPLPPAGVNACVIGGLPTLLTTVRNNITTIYTGLRAAGFKGDFVAVTYYSTNYADPVVTGAVAALNQVLAGVTTSFGGKVANSFGTFGAVAGFFGGDTCKAGLLIHLTPTTCDIHPSRFGATLLAFALAAAQRH
jgi:lysophospholipase L1-like esterase